MAKKKTPYINRWWEKKASKATSSKAGRPYIFETPDELWQACCEYFEWIESHPVYETKLMQHKDQTWYEQVPKPRPMTREGLFRFLNISAPAWWHYRNEKSEEFSKVVNAVDNIIYEQKYTGAAVGLYNANIVGRDLGLREHHEVSGPDGGPIKYSKEVDFSNLTDDELKIILKAKPELFEDK